MASHISAGAVVCKCAISIYQLEPGAGHPVREAHGPLRSLGGGAGESVRDAVGKSKQIRSNCRKKSSPSKPSIRRRVSLRSVRTVRFGRGGFPTASSALRPRD